MEQFCLARALGDIEQGRIATLVVAQKDRLAQFEYLQYVVAKNGCTILIADQESVSPEQELVEDLHAFSCRLYGLRRYETMLRDLLTGGAW